MGDTRVQMTGQGSNFQQFDQSTKNQREGINIKYQLGNTQKIK